MSGVGGLLRGALWTAGMKVVVAGISFAFFAVVARHWGAERLGELSLIYACYMIAQQLPLLGLHYPLMRDVAQRPADAPRLIRTVGAVGFCAALIFSLGLTFGGPALYGEHLRVAFLLIGLSLFPGVIAALAESVLIGREQLAQVAQISMVETFIRTCLWLAIVAFGGNLVMLCLLLVFGRIVVAMFYLQRVADLTQSLQCWRSTRVEVMEQLRASPAFFSILVLTACINRLDFLLLSRISGTATLGMYSTPYRIFEGMLMVPQAVTVALAPRLARDFGAQETPMATSTTEEPKVDREALVHLVCRLAVLIGLPVAIVLGLVAAPLIRIIFGEQFEAGAPVLMWLAVVPVLAAIDQCLGILLLVTHRQRADLGVLIVGASVYALTLLVLIPVYGATGAAAATTITAAVQVLTRYLTVRRLVGIRSIIGDLWRSAAAAGAAASVTLLLQTYAAIASSIVAQCAVFTSSYMLAVLIFRAVAASEIRSCFSLLKRLRNRRVIPARGAPAKA